MDNAAATFIDTYKKLLVLSEQQWKIVNHSNEADQIVEFQALELQKQECQAVIERIASDIQVYSSIADKHREQIITFIEQLQTVHNRLQQHITNQHAEDSQEMKKVANLRKTVQAYGGLNNSDIISYYFDEKQ